MGRGMLRLSAVSLPKLEGPVCTRTGGGSIASDGGRAKMFDHPALCASI